MLPRSSATAMLTAWFLGVAASAAAAEMEHVHRGHAHDTMREADGPAPTVALEATPDGLGGYNLHIAAGNFRFSPERAGTRTESVEGHAHLYVNGVKKARVYGPWFYLPDDWLAAGDNSVRVTLNDNVHTVWAVDGKPVAAEVVLTKSGAFDGTVIELEIGDGPAETIAVAQGAAVRLVLHAPEGTELHLHGYDLTGTAGSGSPVTITFDAHHVGRFPIEAHGIEDDLGRSEKVVAYIEVRSE